MLGLLLVVLLFGMVPLYYLCRYLWELIQLSGDPSKRAVFVTGCDSGFGRLLALKLARHGMPTYAGCFTKSGEAELAEEADQLGIAKWVKPLPLDVTDDQSVKGAAEFVRKELESEDIELWALVNNAGNLSCYGPDAWTSIEDYKQSMEVNCWGTVRCTQAFLPLLKHSKGRIVSISSVAGRFSIPCGAPYSVAKYGVEAYMDAIRLELACWDITCCILEPGIFRTKLIDAGTMAARVERAWQKLGPEMREEYGEQFKDKFVTGWNHLFQETASDRLDDVVDSYFHAVTARFPRARYRIGWDAILVYIPFTFLPTGLGDLIIRFIAHISAGKPTLPAAVERERMARKKVQ